EAAAQAVAPGAEHELRRAELDGDAQVGPQVRRGPFPYRRLAEDVEPVGAVQPRLHPGDDDAALRPPQPYAAPARRGRRGDVALVAGGGDIDRVDAVLRERRGGRRVELGWPEQVGQAQSHQCSVK